jgi:hypothetical protein
MQKGFFGPVSMNGTQLYNIMDEHLVYLGNRL